MRVAAKWAVLWSLWAARLVRQPTPALSVHARAGWLRGDTARAGTHRAYFGVPYATVTPQRRFQAAIPKPTWEGILDATSENIRCTQRFTNNFIIGQEECLTLNIYTPIEESDNLIPVMVFFHGGGFRDGSGSPFLYGPEYLVKHNVILVTVNYRLEVLGFLCLRTEDAPGNAGLKDQVEALKWVNNNIGVFGGNPNDVTIFGVSAGSASVMYHLISPMSKGLFHKAILQSGSAFSPWSFQHDPLKTAGLFAKQMGYVDANPKNMYKLFMTKTAEELLKTRVPRDDGDIILSENIFVPCVEKNISGVEQFLSDTPYNLLLNKKYHKVPLMIGFNNAEGYMFVGKENKATLSKFNIFKALPRDLEFTSDNDRAVVAERLSKIYTESKKIPKTNYENVVRYEGDVGITYSVIATIDLLLQNKHEAPIYIYKFCYDGWLNIVKIISGFWNAPGASHADDIFYIFKPSFYLPHTYFESENVDRVTTMWTNFVKYGEPTPQLTPLLPVKWRPADVANPTLFVIDQQFTTEPLWKDDTMLVWNSTYTKYRRKK